jgi:hypothetical protein
VARRHDPQAQSQFESDRSLRQPVRITLYKKGTMEVIRRLELAA